MPGSRNLEVVLSSGNVHVHCVGLPPDVSRKSTANGAIPLIGLGVITVFPLNATFGADPPPPPAEPTAVMDDATGNRDAAETATFPPTTWAMPGVITPNVQPIWTSAVSPRSMAN